MPRAVKAWIGAGAALTLLFGAFVVAGLLEARARPIAREARIVLPGWPSEAAPLRIALLSDIHLGNRAMDAARLRDIVGEINAARPDLVLIAGDFVIGHAAAGAAEGAQGLTAPLTALQASYGVVAVLGNHDHWTAPNAIRAALAKAGVEVLENSAARMGPLAFIGIGDVFSGHDEVGKALREARRVGGVPIVLTHAPDLVAKLPPGLPLVLAGHTHCGQVVLPWFGPLLTRSPLQQWRSLYDRRYRCGIISDRGRTVVVTAGLGSGSSPVRFGAPSDWWLLTVGGSRSHQRPPVEP